MSRLDIPEDPVSLLRLYIVAGSGGFCCRGRLEVSYDDHYTWRLALSSSMELGRWRSAPLHAQCDVYVPSHSSGAAGAAVQASAASDTTALQAHVDQCDGACAVVRRALCFWGRRSFVLSPCRVI